VTHDEAEAMIEYVGYVWKDDQPRIDFKIQAKSREDAKREVMAKYGDEFAISIWSESEAKRIR
jgi:hypothetical protein